MSNLFFFFPPQSLNLFQFLYGYTSYTQVLDETKDPLKYQLQYQTVVFFPSTYTYSLVALVYYTAFTIINMHKHVPLENVQCLIIFLRSTMLSAAFLSFFSFSVSNMILKAFHFNS